VMAAALAWGAQLAAAALGWAPPALYPIGPNPLRSWIFAAGMLLGAGLVLRMLIKRWRAGSGPEAMAAVLLLLALASAALLVVFPGASYVMVLTTLALMAVWLTPARGRAWTAVPAAFLIVVVFAPVLWFMHEALSLTAMWATVFMAITPVAPLTLVLMSAGWPQDGQAPRTTSPASAAKALA
jgi:membrane protein